MFTERRVALVNYSSKTLDIVDLDIIKRIRVGWREDTGALTIAKISGTVTAVLLVLVNIKGPLHDLWVFPALSAIVFIYYLLKYLASRGATLEFLCEYGEEPVLRFPVSSCKSATVLINDLLKAKGVQDAKLDQESD